MLSTNSVLSDAQPTGSKVIDTEAYNNNVSELESVISKTIENNKKFQEIAPETGILQQHTNTQTSDIDIVPLVETVLDDERIEIASRQPASADNNENINQSKETHKTFANKAYIMTTLSTTEAEIEINNDTRFEITSEMVTELSSVVSTTETIQVRILLHHHRTPNQILFNVHSYW